jgi:hypothetical protein
LTLSRSVDIVVCLAALLAATGCGSGSSAPTTNPTPIGITPTPSSSPSGIVLPAGMTCSPTPPPLLRMELKIHSTDNGRIVLDSKPVVPNIDHYCDRVGFGDWKFCDTRPEGDPQRVACDYLATGKAIDTGRWGPNWIGEGKTCGAEFSLCANHPDNQFMAIAKGHGEFQACVSPEAAIDASKGVRCGVFEYY